MKKILFILLLLPFVGISQIKQPYNQYGARWLRSSDSLATQIPRKAVGVRDYNLGFDTAQIYYNPFDSTIKYYTGFQWLTLAVGSSGLFAGDTVNKWVGSIFKRNDSIYYKVGTTEIFAYIDSSGSGGGGGSGIGRVYAGAYLANVNDSTLKLDTASFFGIGLRRKDSLPNGYYPWSNPAGYITDASELSDGDTTIFKTVIDSTASDGFRVLYGVAQKIKSKSTFLFDSINNKLVINHNMVSIGGPNNKLVVKGNSLVTDVFTMGSGIINNTPSTSAGSFDLLTRATSGGAIEKVSSSYFIKPSDSATMLANYVTTNGYGLLKTGKAFLFDSATVFPQLRATITSGISSLSSLGSGLDIQTGGLGNIRTLNTNNFSVSSNLIDVKTQMSITSNSSGLKLVGDASAPGNSKYYGTDAFGTKGFYNVPTTPGIDDVLSLSQNLTADRDISANGHEFDIFGVNGFKLTHSLVSGNRVLVDQNTTKLSIGTFGAADIRTFELFNDSTKLTGLSAGAGKYSLRIDSRGNITYVDTTAGGGGGGYTSLNQFVNESNWKTFYSNGSGDVQELAIGAANTALVSTGSSSAPSFQAIELSFTEAAQEFTGTDLLSYDGTTGFIVTVSNTPKTSKVRSVSVNGILLPSSYIGISGAVFTVTGLPYSIAASDIITVKYSY